jgi:lipase chaperone LimK
MQIDYEILDLPVAKNITSSEVVKNTPKKSKQKSKTKSKENDETFVQYYIYYKSKLTKIILTQTTTKLSDIKFIQKKISFDLEYKYNTLGFNELHVIE